MLDPLRRADQGEVGRGVFLLLALGHDFLTFFDKTHHALAGLGARGLAEQLKAFIDALDLGFGLAEMQLEQLAQLVESRRFRHLGKRLRQLLLGVKDVAELVDQQVAKTGLVDRR